MYLNVLNNPVASTSTTNSPGANSRTFILIDTAKLNERTKIQYKYNYIFNKTHELNITIYTAHKPEQHASNVPAFEEQK